METIPGCVDCDDGGRDSPLERKDCGCRVCVRCWPIHDALDCSADSVSGYIEGMTAARGHSAQMGEPL